MQALSSIQAQTWALLLTIMLGGMLAYYLLFFLLKRWSRNKKRFIPFLLEKYLKTPGFLLVVVIALSTDLAIIRYHLPFEYLLAARHALQVLYIITIGFLLMKSLGFVREILLRYHAQRNYRDYTLRSVKTKYLIIQRILNVLILILAVSAILMTFSQIRQVGATLLASAGVAGIVLGFAAQKSLGTLFAGIQIALSQPIKIDDTVVVEDTFGTIGEITLTYVVVNTWDEKRLIVPINYFIENSIENWTRVSPEVVGQVKIYADYALPVEEVRAQALAWLKESPLWDGRKAAVLVTDANERTMVVRVSFSAKNADDAWDLECTLREKLIGYIREKYPHALPTARINLSGTGTSR
jgi:small-conductance mechanosensitive channel